MQLWILLRLIKQPPDHYYWARQKAQGRAVDGPKSPVLIKKGQVRMLYYLTLRELTLDKVNYYHHHILKFTPVRPTRKAAFFQKWQYYNKRNKTKQKVFSIGDPTDFDPERLTVQRSLLGQKNCQRKRRAENCQNWEGSKVIYPFQRLSS